MIDHKVLVHVVVKTLECGVQCVENVLEAAFKFVVVAIEHCERRVQISATTGIIEFQSPLIEVADIVRIEKHSLRV